MSLLTHFKVIREQSVWMQLLFFGVIAFASFILFAFLGQLITILVFGFSAFQDTMSFVSNPQITDIANDDVSQTVFILTIIQISSQTGLFIAPPIIFGLLMYGNRIMGKYGLTKTPDLFSSMMVIALVFLILPFVAWLIKVNMALPLPESLVRAEENAARMITLFFQDSGISRLVLNLFMIALIPAIGEELFFRGIVQRLLTKGLRNVHVAVFVTAIIFSLFHFQFEGFIPRVALGIVFGYLFVWSGNLFLPVLAHFLNNGSAVVIEFLSRRGVVGFGYEDFGHDPSLFMILFSITVSAMVCFAIWKNERFLKQIV